MERRTSTQGGSIDRYITVIKEMKTATEAIQGISTCELTELADTVWRAQKSDQRTAGRLEKTKNWQLVEAAEELSRQHKRAFREESAEKDALRALPMTSERRRGHWFKRLWQWLKGSPGGIEQSSSSVQPAGSGAPDSAVRAEQETLQSASPAGAVEDSQQEREELQDPQPEIDLKNLNQHVRKFVGQTIIGRVTFEMVLAELERRGYPYRPPIKEDGTLVIRECDLTNETVTSFRRVRPGIERLLRAGSYQRLKIEAASPVRIDHPVVNEHSQFESSVAVSLPVLKARAIVAPHLHVDGSVEAVSVKARKLECNDLNAKAVDAVNLFVEHDAKVKRLDGTHFVRVRGKATIGSLGDNIPENCKVDGKSVAAAFREITRRTQPNKDLNRRPGVMGSADHRIEAAFNILQSQGRPISTSRLARLSATNYGTAKRWLKEHHAERPVRDQDESDELEDKQRQPTSHRVRV